MNFQSAFFIFITLIITNLIHFHSVNARAVGDPIGVGLSPEEWNREFVYTGNSWRKIDLSRGFESPDCKDTKDGEETFPHRKCNWFYICIQGKKYEFACAEGFSFDLETRVCTDNGNGRCNNEPSANYPLLRKSFDEAQPNLKIVDGVDTGTDEESTENSIKELVDSQMNESQEDVAMSSSQDESDESEQKQNDIVQIVEGDSNEDYADSKESDVSDYDQEDSGEEVDIASWPDFDENEKIANGKDDDQQGQVSIANVDQDSQEESSQDLNDEFSAEPGNDSGEFDEESNEEPIDENETLSNSEESEENAAAEQDVSDTNSDYDDDEFDYVLK